MLEEPYGRSVRSPEKQHSSSPAMKAGEGNDVLCPGQIHRGGATCPVVSSNCIEPRAGEPEVMYACEPSIQGRASVGVSEDLGALMRKCVGDGGVLEGGSDGGNDLVGRIVDAEPCLGQTISSLNS